MSDIPASSSHALPAPALSGAGAIPTPKQRFNKACDSCHVSKVRCVPDPDSPVGACRRCTKHGNQCAFSPVGPRRRPARTKNDRIAELERRVRDMQLKLEKQVEKRAGGAPGRDASASHPAYPGTMPESASRSTPASGLDPGPTWTSGSTTAPALPVTAPASGLVAVKEPEAHLLSSGTDQRIAAVTLSSAPHTSTASTAGEPRTSPKRELDVIDQGLITETQANKLVQEFRVSLNGKFLGICLPDHVDPERLRRERPAFWLSILCAASAGSTELTCLAPVLFGEMKKILDSRISSEAEPDLDALQALMIYVAFHYGPVSSMGDQMMKIYGAAMSMAVKMAEASEIHRLPDDSAVSEDDVADEDMQLAREILHWYWASVTLLIKSRQDITMRLIRFVNPSLRVVRMSHRYQDMRLTQWTRLVQIAGDTVLALHRGHTKETGGLSDEARDGILESFERRRKQWLVECPFDIVNETLMLDYHYYALLISEVIYPAGVADFKRRSHGLPALSTTQADTAPIPDQNFFAPYKIRHTRRCIKAAHACLDVVTAPSESNSFNSISPEDVLRRLGVLPYSRVFYALRFLLFVAHEIFRTKRHEVVGIETLEVDAYIASLKRRLVVASSGGSYRLPSLWLYALTTRIEPWYRELRALLDKEHPTEGSRRPPQDDAPKASAGGASPTGEAPQADGDQTWFSEPMLPLLLEFPFELFSSPDVFSMPPSRPLNGSSRASAARKSRAASIEPPTENRPSPTAACNSTDMLQAGLCQADSTGDLNTWLGATDVNPFSFNWDDYSEIWPGSDMFLSPVPPYLTPNEAVEGGYELDGGGEAS